jgi:hypothetical protein
MEFSSRTISSLHGDGTDGVEGARGRLVCTAAAAVARDNRRMSPAASSGGGR